MSAALMSQLIVSITGSPAAVPNKSDDQVAQITAATPDIAL